MPRAWRRRTFVRRASASRRWSRSHTLPALALFRASQKEGTRGVHTASDPNPSLQDYAEMEADTVEVPPEGIKAEY